MKLNIRSRTLLIVLVPQCLLALLIGAYFIQWQLQQTSLDLQIQGERGADQLASTAEFWMLSGNTEQLLRLLEMTMKDQELVEGLLIIGADGKTVSAVGLDSEVELARVCWQDASRCQSSTRHVYSTPIHSAGLVVSDNPEFLLLADAGASAEKIVGTAFIVMSSESLQDLQRNVIASGVLIILISVFLTVLVALSFARGLSLPILRLSRVVSRIQKGDFSARVNPMASGELRDLEAGINVMAERVQKANNVLQSRVQQATEKLSHTLDNLEQRNTELTEAREIAENASKAKDMFLARMSHELRTPLATVIGYSRLILLADNQAQKMEYGQIMEQAADLLQVTIDDILDHVRLQDDAVHLKKADFNLLDCIESAVAMHVPAAHAKRVELISCCDDSLPAIVHGDSVRLAQIITNLLSNAIKFTHEGHVILHAFAQKKAPQEYKISIAVRDSGIGISAEKQAQLFLPFVQADESINRNFGGSGLGLAIVKRLAEYMGGEVKLASEPDQGTLVEVSVVLPAIDDTSVMPQQPVFLSHTDQIVGFDPIGEVGNIICQNLELFGGEVQSYDYFEHFIKDIRLSSPVLVIASFRFDDQIRARVADVRRVYQGPFLILTSDSNVIDNWDNYWLGKKDKILKKPLKREYFRRICRELIRGVESDENVIMSPLPVPEQFDCTVLVVEDNQLNLKLIVTQLKEHGVKVLAAGSGSEALYMMDSIQPDLAFIDVHMPGMDGVSLAIRLQELRPDLPVYALTANVMGTEEGDLLAAGVRKVFYKPISEELLVGVLDGCQVGQQRRRGSPTKLHIPKGMHAGEIIQEMDSLHDEARALLDDEAYAELAAVCHKLHGVIKIFTRGDLVDMVQGLERMARDGEYEAVISALDALQREVEQLRLVAMDTG